MMINDYQSRIVNDTIEDTEINFMIERATNFKGIDDAKVS
jgi:hypothetical protein